MARRSQLWPTGRPCYGVYPDKSAQRKEWNARSTRRPHLCLRLACSLARPWSVRPLARLFERLMERPLERPWSVPGVVSLERLMERPLECRLECPLERPLERLMERLQK